VWELRGGALRVFPGSFVEWEEARAEAQAKADQVARAAAQADAARAREREKQREKERDRARDAGRAPDTGDRRAALRRARKQLEETEQRVQLLEAEVAALTARLDDAALYDTPAGVEKATRWGRELDEARDALEAAMAEWATASETVEQLQA